MASPYSHPDPAVRERRYQAACRQAAEILRLGIPVFSPVVYRHALLEYGLPHDWAFWRRKMERKYRALCDQVWVLMLDGWRESVDVQTKIVWALKGRKRVLYVDPYAPMFTSAISEHAPESTGACQSRGETDATP